MNMPKPDTFVIVVKALSDKLAEKELECVELVAHITTDHARMDEMQRTLTQKRQECESLYNQNDNLTYDINRLRTENRDLRDRQPSYDYYKDRCAQLEQELLTLKFGGETDPIKRATTYMQKEGGKLWASGNKIGCIKGVRECTAWGLKDAKDWCEANGASFTHKVPELATTTDSGPKTQPSEDLKRKAS